MKFDFIPLFSGLNKDELSLLDEVIHVNEYPEEKILFLEGEAADAFYIVLEGEVRIVKSTSQGKEKILDIMETGDFFGEMGVIEEKLRSASAYITKESKMLIIEKDDFIRIIKNNPDIALKIITELSRRLRWANNEIEGLAFHNVKTRLKNLLLKMAREEQERLIINKKITHQALAKYIGSSRETVTRLINQLEEEGKIINNKDQIIINNSEEW